MSTNASNDLHKMSGREIINHLAAGDFQVVPSKHVEDVREKVTEACEELISVGARIRPLFCNDTRIGWVRGIHLTERRLLKHWLLPPYELTETILKLATTLDSDYIHCMSLGEVLSLIKLISVMGEYDNSLYPFLLAFASTSISEQMWSSNGNTICSFQNKVVPMPDGSSITIKQASDHARLWATLCTYREANKRRLDGSLHALMIVRPWAGRAADPIANDLQYAAKRMQPDIIDPWKEIIWTNEPVLDDGWAHSGVDNSTEGVYREMQNMLSVDRHERLMQFMEKQQKEAAEKEQQRINDLLSGRKSGVEFGGYRAMTDEEVQKRLSIVTPRPKVLVREDADMPHQRFNT